MRFEFAHWLTKSNSFNDKNNRGIPLPMRVMFGKVIRATNRGYIIDVYGKPEPSTHCLHCMRKLTHKVSMFYGLGPVCGEHFYIINVSEADLELKLDDIRKRMADIKWRGLVPKNAVTLSHEDIHTIVFEFDGVRYRTTTSDMTKVREIYAKGQVESDEISLG